MAKEDNFKGKRNTNGFDKRPQDINRSGRPKKMFNYIKEKGFAKDDIREAFMELAFHDFDELKLIVSDREQPALFRIVARQLNKALTKGDWNAISEIITQIIGKPKQEVTGDVRHDVTSVVDLLSKKEEYESDLRREEGDKED